MNHRTLSVRLLTLSLLALLLSLLSGHSFALTPLKLQLRGPHQFEFAGYYAALEKGFYQDEGLDVKLLEGTPSVSTVNEVMLGRAQFGVSTSGLLGKR